LYNSGPGNDEHGSLSIIPNPNNGDFTISGTLQHAVNGSEVKIEVTDLLGKTIYTDVASIKNSTINKNISLRSNIPNGVYIIRVKNDDATQVLQFTLDR